MDAALQGVEFDVALGVADDQLAVEHVTPQREAQLGEVAGEVFPSARLDVGLAAVDEDDRAEAVELLLVGPLLAFGGSALRVSASCGLIGGTSGRFT